MPQPVHTDLHIDALLTMLSLAYLQDPANFIAREMFPEISVPKQSNKIAEYNKDFFLRDEARLRAPATETFGGGFEVTTTKTYFCDNFGFHTDVPDEERKNYDAPFDPDADATSLVTEKMRLREEVAWANDFFKTSVWGTDIVGGTGFTKWSDYGASDPIADVETGKEAIFSVTGRNPNKLAIGRAVWAKMKHHPDFIERIKFVMKGVLTADIVASILEVERLLVAQAIQATSKEGQTGAYSYVFGKNGLLCYTPPRAGLRIPTAYIIRRVRDDKGMYDRIEGLTWVDAVSLGTDLGYFFSLAVA
jgi:hypothetical protein